MTVRPPLSGELRRELDALRAAGLYRAPRIVDGAQGPRVVADGRECLCFCSNDYLGLAAHPAVAGAARGAIERCGWGAGASRLVSGTMRLHDELERALAAFKGKEAAIAFPSGYAANVGTIAALAGPGDTVVIDRLDHASIVDGCRLSGAAIRVYPHGNVGRLERILSGTRGSRRTLVVTDSLFSMDGDLAPLAEIAAAARRHGARLMADEAHATGVLGENGRGGAELLGVEDAVDISMGTLSKALGGSGGFVAGSAALVDWLRHRARSYVYTTAPPPAACAAALAALGIVSARPELRRLVLARAERLRAGLASLGLDTMGSAFQIVPVRVGGGGRGRASLAGALPARHPRPGHPPADRAERVEPPAPRGDGRPRGRRHRPPAGGVRRDSRRAEVIHRRGGAVMPPSFSPPPLRERTGGEPVSSGVGIGIDIGIVPALDPDTDFESATWYMMRRSP